MDVTKEKPAPWLTYYWDDVVLGRLYALKCGLHLVIAVPSRVSFPVKSLAIAHSVMEALGKLVRFGDIAAAGGSFPESLYPSVAKLSALHT